MKTLLILASGVGACSPVMAQVVTNPEFTGVGDLAGGAFASQALGVSYSTDAVVVGDSQSADGWRAFRWTPLGGIESLGTLAGGDAFSAAYAIGRNGDVIVGASGFAPSPFESAAFRWTQATGMQALGPFAGGGTTSLAFAVVSSGNTIVGQGGATPGGPRAFRWTLAGGATGLGTLPGGGEDNSAATGLAGNDIVVGYAQAASFATEAFRWTPATGMVGLGHLNATGFQDSRAQAVSLSGTVVVGESTSPNGPQEAFRWTGPGGMVGLGDLSGGAFRSVALATGSSGSTVVGWSETGSGNRAFIWTAAGGMRDLKTELEGLGFNLTGWTLLRATAMTVNGRAIAGVGVNPAGQTEGWVATYGCYYDCNGDGAPTVADFGCFQTRFVLGHPYGDCNRDGFFTVADFGCYSTAFVALSCD